jgi:hypothetical protein
MCDGFIVCKMKRCNLRLLCICGRIIFEKQPFDNFQTILFTESLNNLNRKGVAQQHLFCLNYLVTVAFGLSTDLGNGFEEMGFILDFFLLLILSCWL